MTYLRRCLYLLVWVKIAGGGIFSMSSTVLPSFKSNWCFEDAINIHDELSQQLCPYDKLQENDGCKSNTSTITLRQEPDKCPIEELEHTNTTLRTENLQILNRKKELTTTTAQHRNVLDLVVYSQVPHLSRCVFHPHQRATRIAFCMAVKATQVPSLYDRSPISVRSRSSNVYHELSDKVYYFHSTSFI
ncbi:uncharacterized protein LOC125656681 [Ostrea edulis]|uniref:uncharacterized protein LOC125656681 n=1 Tax=Ostrea edulis TaxID=37623 RepID=UPI0024AEE420|nr:uncharacterized protein LOC125656681 [Ostrea edulis]